MKKILSAILAFSLMTVMLAACNKNEGEDTTSAEQTTVYTEENIPRAKSPRIGTKFTALSNDG